MGSWHFITLIFAGIIFIYLFFHIMVEMFPLVYSPPVCVEEFLCDVSLILLKQGHSHKEDGGGNCQDRRCFLAAFVPLANSQSESSIYSYPINGLSEGTHTVRSSLVSLHIMMLPCHATLVYQAKGKWLLGPFLPPQLLHWITSVTVLNYSSQNISSCL